MIPKQIPALITLFLMFFNLLVFAYFVLAVNIQWARLFFYVFFRKKGQLKDKMEMVRRAGFFIPIKTKDNKIKQLDASCRKNFKYVFVAFGVGCVLMAVLIFLLVFFG